VAGAEDFLKACRWLGLTLSPSIAAMQSGLLGLPATTSTTTSLGQIVG
jgi:hypothetical protein